MNIPKPNGGIRPLGIAAIILMPIYEAEFLGFSYGFQPGRGAHNALAVGIDRRKIN